MLLHSTILTQVINSTLVNFSMIKVDVDIDTPKEAEVNLDSIDTLVVPMQTTPIIFAPEDPAKWSIDVVNLL